MLKRFTISSLLFLLSGTVISQDLKLAKFYSDQFAGIALSNKPYTDIRNNTQNSVWNSAKIDTIRINKSPQLSRISDPMFYRIDDETEYVFSRPHPFEFITGIPGTINTFSRDVFQFKNIPTFVLIGASTAILVIYDQQMLDETQRFGRKIGLKGTNRLKPIFSIAGQPIEVPHDADTGMYFIGDGWTQFLITASFFGYGLFGKDNRALQTSSQLAQGLIVVGTVSQVLKHITGRQSPFASSVPAGRWVFFPDQVEYHKHVPEYDAFPSGHLATAMTTVTIIAENYPEKKWIRPVGYTLLTILSLEMVNNGVHWYSDYPLAIGIGYAFGKAISSRGRSIRRINRNSETKPDLFDSFSLHPWLDFQGKMGVGLSYHF